MKSQHSLSAAEQRNISIYEENSRLVANKDSAIGQSAHYSIGWTTLYSGSVKARPAYPGSKRTETLVVNTDTVTAIQECVDTIPAVLNFASAKHPGGGYINGRTAQEECLCRASTLYYVLDTQKGFYDHHNAMSDQMYSNLMIYSSNIMFFRDKHGTRVNPFTADVITAAAPNNSNGELKQSDVYHVVRSRVSKILDITTKHGRKTLILGAWGCGVFKNDPVVIANAFKDSINEFNRPIDTILFAIPGGDNLTAFKSVFDS